jgi:Flp pilus assembly protein TadD
MTGSERAATSTRDSIEIALEHHRAGRLDSARTIYEDVLATEPHHADALHLLGLIAHQNADHDKGLGLIRQALSLDPDNGVYLVNLAEVQRALGDLEQAEATLRRALSLNPASATGHLNLGYVLREQRRLGDAEQCYLQAMRLDPTLTHVKLNYALLLLLRGDYTGGFDYFEARFAAGDDKAIGADRALLAALDAPQWNGEPLSEKSLLLWTEQGLGDNLMMLRYLPMLERKGVGHVTMYCHDPLARLVQQVDGPDEVLLRSRPLPAGAFDFHCPMMSLPRIFSTRIDTIPAQVPYLQIPDGLRRKWAARLADHAAPRVGLVWASGSYTRTGREKSLSFEHIAELLRRNNVRFVSLQKAAQPAHAPDSMLDWMGECDDLLDTAALVSELDLVISIDSAVAHLAGAMAKPVWLLNRFDSDWRWMLDREDCLWYPTMRIFRQSQRGDWSGVVEQVARALDSMSARGDAPASRRPQSTLRFGERMRKFFSKQSM